MPARDTVTDALAVALRAKHSPPEVWPADGLPALALDIVGHAVSSVQASPMRVAWTQWASVKEPQGESFRGSWLDFCESIEGWTSRSCASKLSAPGYAPATFDGDTRADDRVEALYALSLDCDGHGDWVRAIASALDLGLAVLAYRSISHGVVPKWRLMLPLVRPVSGDDIKQWRDWYAAARVLFGALGACWYDPSCSNPSRLWYPPIRVGDVPAREVVVREGHALDLVELGKRFAAASVIEAPKLPLATAPKRRLSELGRIQPVMPAFDRARRWLERVEGAVEGQNGDQATYRVACKLVKDFDLSDADALTLLGEWNARCRPPWSHAELVKKVASARKNGKHTPGEALDTVPDGYDDNGERWEPPALEPEAEGPRDMSGDVIKPKGPGRIKWVKLTEKGNVVSCVENVQAMLEHYQVTARYNLMTHEDEFSSPHFIATADKAQNAAIAQIREWAHHHGLSVPRIDGQLEIIIASNPYHPAADWIGSKPWDGVDRFEALFAAIHLEWQDAERVGLARRMFFAWCVTAAHAAKVPADAKRGVSAQLVLVLLGPQGVQKTRFILSLVPEVGWTREGVMLDPSNRDSVQQATSAWIVELGELDATFRKSDIANLKAHITNTADTYRAAYAHKAETRARRTVYAATVNVRGVLHDETGSRRFGVLPVRDCDSQHGVDMQQFWAQMAAMPEEACFLSAADESALLASNKDHEATDPLFEAVCAAWEIDDRDAPSWQSLRDILEGAKTDNDKQWTTQDARLVGKIVGEKLRAPMRVSRGVRQFAMRRR